MTGGDVQMKNRKVFTIGIAMLLVVGLVLTGCSSTQNETDKAIQTDQTAQQSNTEVVKQEQQPTYIEEDLSKYFAGFNGCYVLYDVEENTYTIHNKEKSTKRLPPNSSFKIYNSLIGLESGVLKDENTLFKWDGTKHGIESWNRDHTLASAFSNSVVWYYRELASRVGEKTMQEYIDKIGYGNQDISGGIDKFWLQSSIEISPMEQVELLRKFYSYELPFARENIDIVKKIMIISDENNIILRGKTGSGMKGNNAINGWFVGYVENQGKVYFFAANIEGEKDAMGVKAKEITIEILKDKDLL